VPVFFDAKVFALHPDHDVDGVLESFGPAKTSLFGLVTDDKNDPVSNGVTKIADVMRIGARARVPGIEHIDQRPHGLEVRTRFPDGPALTRIKLPRVDVRNGANVAIHLFDLAFGKNNGAAMKRRDAQKIGGLPDAAGPVDEDHRAGHRAALSERRIVVGTDRDPLDGVRAAPHLREGQGLRGRRSALRCPPRSAIGALLEVRARFAVALEAPEHLRYRKAAR
jgi:hypothetical protein